MDEKLLYKIALLESEAVSKIKDANFLLDLKNVELSLFGKRGKIKLFLSKLKEINDTRKKVDLSKVINLLRSKLEELIANKKVLLRAKELNSKLRDEIADITLPIRPEKIGKIHPLSKVISETKLIFKSMGFKEVDGSDIEDEFHVFDALNTPNYHPVREEQNTFYLKRKINSKRMLLRTHTSSVQIRILEKTKVFPIKIISVGRVYRKDLDATHTPMFHQIEGLYVNKNVNIGQLKFTIHCFLNKFFEDEKKLKIRFRNSFFPFTEPSAEVDVSYKCNKWIEVLGCGLIHPNVFQNVGIDCTKYNGFAFGIGIERLAMMKYQVCDLRDFYYNKINWLDHYGFHFLSLK